MDDRPGREFERAGPCVRSQKRAGACTRASTLLGGSPLGGKTALLLGGLLLVSPGCISVYHYQPLQGLHRSYALSYKEANFTGLTLRLSCIANAFVSESAAGVLCDKLRTVFEGQGAKVLDGETEGAPFDYGLEFEATETYLHRNAWMWPVSILLLTLFPVEQEYAFTQSVTLTRGSDGSPLRKEAFEARFLWFWGAGYWALNKLFNATVRDAAEKVDDASMRRDFSRDFYSQVSQLVYNARARDAFRNAKAPTP